MNQHRHTGQITTILVLYQRATNVRSLTHTLPGLLGYKTGVCVFLATTISWQCFLQYRMPSACAYVFNLKRNIFLFTEKHKNNARVSQSSMLRRRCRISFYQCTRVQIGICFPPFRYKKTALGENIFRSQHDLKGKKVSCIAYV